MGGAFHIGVEVFGSEWSYGCCGVRSALPRGQCGHVYSCSVCLGQTSVEQAELASILHRMCQEWKGSDYQLLSHNCCNFASELCDHLGVGPVPAWISRLPRFLGAGRRAGSNALAIGRTVSEAVVCKSTAFAQLAWHRARLVTQSIGKSRTLAPRRQSLRLQRRKSYSCSPKFSVTDSSHGASRDSLSCSPRKRLDEVFPTIPFQPKSPGFYELSNTSFPRSTSVICTRPTLAPNFPRSTSMVCQPQLTVQPFVPATSKYRFDAGRPTVIEGRRPLTTVVSFQSSTTDAQTGANSACGRKTG